MSLSDSAEGIVFQIGGDISPLQQALDAIPAAGAKAGQALSDAFDATTAGFDSAARGAETLASSVQDVGTAASAAAGGVGNLPPVLQSTAGAAGQAASGVNDLGAALIGLGAGLITFATLRDLAEETAQAFGKLQLAEIALGAITGDATAAAAALQTVKQLADQLGFAQESFITAEQKLVALQVPLAQIPQALEAIATGARGMLVPFDQALQRFDLAVDSGQLAGRSLTALGLTIQDVAAAMGMANQPLQVIRDSFKNLAETGERAQVISAALFAKFPTVADAAATSVVASWQRVENAGTTALQEIGRQLDGFSGLFQVIVGAIKILETAFTGLLLPIKVVADTVVLLVSGVVDAIEGIIKALYNAASGNLADAGGAIRDTFTKVKADFQNFGQNIQQDWKATSDAMSRIWASSADKINVATDGIAPHVDLVNKSLDKWNDSWEKSAQKAIDAFNAIGNGGKSAAVVLTQINSVLEQASLNAGKMSANSKAMLAVLQDDAWYAKMHTEADLQAKDIQKTSDAIGTLEDAADRAMAKVPADFAAMTAAVANGANFSGLGKTFDDLILKLQQDLKALPDSMASFGPEIQDKITKLQYAKTAIEEMNGALQLIGQDQSMTKLGSQIESLIGIDQSFTLTQNQVQAALNSIGTTLQSKVIPAMQQGVEITPKFIDQLKDLDSVAPGVGTALASAAAGGVDKFIAAVQSMVEQSRAGVLSVETAFQDLGVVTFDKASQNLKRFSNDIVGSLGKITGSVQEGTPQWDTYADAILSWADKALPVIQKGGTIGPDVVASIAKVAPAFADAINRGIDPFMAASAKLREQVVADRTTEAASYQAAGAVMISTLQNVLDLEQRQLQVLRDSNAPQEVQLQMAQKILQTQLQMAAATDQTTTAAAGLVVKITEVQLAQYAAHQQTMGLADAWTGLAKGVTQAWTDMEKSLASAIVAGQGFGQVMTTMLKGIETTIVEVAVKYILGQLVSSLLTSLGFSASLITSLGILGPASTLASGTVSASMTAAATAMTTAAGAMATSATAMAATVTTSMGTAAASTTAASGTIVTATAAISASMVALATVVGALGAVIGAVASIIGAIQLAHISNLLGEIEVTTRKMENELGGNGSESIFGYTKLGTQTLQTIMAMLWNPIIALLNDMSGNLDDISRVEHDSQSLLNQILGAIEAGGGTGGGGGNWSTPTWVVPLSTAAADLASAAQDVSQFTSELPSSALIADNFDSASQNINESANNLAAASDASMVAASALAAATPTGTAAPAIVALTTQGVGAGDGGVQIIPIGQVQYPSAAVNSGGAGGDVSGNGRQPWISVPITVQGNIVGAGGMQQLSMMVGDMVATKMRQGASLIKA